MARSVSLALSHVTKSSRTGQIVDIGTEAECVESAEFWNTEYQTNEFIVEEYK